MTDKEHDLAVYRDRLEDLRELLSQAEDTLATAEEDYAESLAASDADSLPEIMDRLAQSFDYVDYLRNEIAEVEYSIWQLESSDEEEGGEFFN
jgi:hypothetical protein|nr:MAG TPA: hypothetical protein [Inoviridae sp.]